MGEEIVLIPQTFILSVQIDSRKEHQYQRCSLEELSVLSISWVAQSSDYIVFGFAQKQELNSLERRFLNIFSNDHTFFSLSRYNNDGSIAFLVDSERAFSVFPAQNCSVPKPR